MLHASIAKLLLLVEGRRSHTVVLELCTLSTLLELVLGLLAVEQYSNFFKGSPCDVTRPESVKSRVLIFAEG